MGNGCPIRLYRLLIGFVSKRVGWIERPDKSDVVACAGSSVSGSVRKSGGEPPHFKGRGPEGGRRETG